MPVNKKQSSLNAVRDQMSLDYASGKYLNNISNNLGFIRPKFGFTDDMWRAITKVLAVQEKQVKDKFGDALEVLFGPRDTLGLTLSKNAKIADKVIYVHSLDGVPEIGTIIIDEGLATVETVNYILLDRGTNAMYLETGLAYAHSAVSNDFSSYLIVPSSSTTLFLNDVSKFPLTYFPAPMVLSPSLPNEEVVKVNSVNTSNNTVILASAPTLAHAAPSSSLSSTTLSRVYVNNSNVLACANTVGLPLTGRLTITDLATCIGTVSSATTSVITLSSPTTFTVNELIGCSIVVTGASNPALDGTSAYIISNTSNTITLSAPMGTALSPGDLFAFYINTEYVYNDYTANVLTLKNNLPKSFTYQAASTTLYLNKIESKASLSQIKIKRGCWDIMETTPRVVELLLCSGLSDLLDLRSSSYLHDSYSGTPVTTTMPSGGAPGATTITVASTSNFNTFDEVKLTSGILTQVLSVSKHPLTSLANTTTSTSTVINLISPISVAVNSLVGTYVYIGTDYKYIAKISANTTTSITLVNPIPSYVLSFISTDNKITVYSPTLFDIVNKQTLSFTFTAGSTVTQYRPILTGTTNVVDGNVWSTSIPGLFSGPYVYDFIEYAAEPNSVVAPYPRLSQQLPGSKALLVESTIGNTALEVKDAKYFTAVGFPYDIILGDQTSQREQVTVTALNYRDSVESTVTSVGTLSFSVTSLTGPGNNDDFPLASGYRIIIDEGLVNEEIFYVTSVDVPTKTLHVSNTPVYTHLAGATVRLVSDVFTINPLLNNHSGIIPLSQATSTFPSITSTNINNAETLCELSNGITISNTTGFPASGRVILNKGLGFLARSTTLTANDSNSGTLHVSNASVFPTTGTFKVTVSKGTANEEVLFISSVNTGLSTLTYTHNERKNHYVGDLVVLEASQEEIFEYSSIVGNTLRFSFPTMLKYSHEIYETVIPSVGRSIPRSNGYDFPFRMPPSVEFRIRYIIDLIRAAGVQVNIKILSELEILSLRR